MSSQRPTLSSRGVRDCSPADQIHWLLSFQNGRQTRVLPWAKSSDCPETYTRTLTTNELQAPMTNDFVDGTMGLFLGAIITIDDLELGALEATWCQCLERHGFPPDGKSSRWRTGSRALSMSNTSSKTASALQSGRTERCSVSIRRVGGNVRSVSLAADLSFQTRALIALLYLILDPEQSIGSGRVKFELLLRVHHSLTDAAGMRTIMHLVLSGLAASDQSSSYTWGTDEGLRLPPSPVDAFVISDEMAKMVSQI
jgi:hypothetical protein